MERIMKQCYRQMKERGKDGEREREREGVRETERGGERETAVHSHS
jgi:hypothetical protein